MAEKEEKEVESKEEAPAVDKTKKTVILLMVLSVLVMVLTPVITIFSIRMMTKETVEPVQPPKRTTHEISLPKVQVNIAETNGTRFLQVDIIVEVNDPEIIPIFEERTPENERGNLKRIMAVIINLVSDKNISALVSKEAKIKLAKELKNAINNLLHEEADGIVTDVYFYSFLIQ